MLWKWKDIASRFVWYFVEYFSADPVGPMIPLNRFVESPYKCTCIIDILQNFDTIQKEILSSLSYATPIEGDEFFESDITNDGKWKKIYLKWYASPPSYARELFPQTLAILERHPEIRLAMVSKLEPWAHIKPHRGVYRGSIRVHVGIQTPNSPKCFISIDNQHYWWKDGEIVAFDDTYEHYVENNTPRVRVVLFMDIDRRMKFAWAQKILEWITRYICSKTTRSNKELELKNVRNYKLS